MATPTYATVLNQINSYIVANGDNEITANVLNPILQLITDFANNNIGDLDELTTAESNSIVEAVNSLKQNFDDLVNNGVQLYTGINNPNETPPTAYNYADFYMQLDIDSLPVKLWQWNGFDWIDLVSSKIYKEGEFCIFKNPANANDSILEAGDIVTGIVEGMFINASYLGGDTSMLTSFDIVNQTEI